MCLCVGAGAYVLLVLWDIFEYIHIYISVYIYTCVYEAGIEGDDDTTSQSSLRLRHDDTTIVFRSYLSSLRVF